MPEHHHCRRTFGKQTVAAVTVDGGSEKGAATEVTWAVGNGLYLQGQIAGSKVSFLVDAGSGVSILAAWIWREWDRPRDELANYWGEGRALECLGQTRLAVTLGTHVIEWDFIVVEIGEDERILGNDFAMEQDSQIWVANLGLGDRGEPSDCDGGVHDGNTRDMPEGQRERHG